jgi:flagellar basal body-associated protein FliL
MKNFLKLIALFLLVVTLGSTTGAGVVYAAEHASEAPAGDGGHKAEKPKKSTAHPAGEGAPKASESGGLGGSKVYVTIGPIILPIINDDGPQQIVTMIVSLQVKDTNDSDLVREQLPRLIDGFMRALYGKLDANTMHHGTVVDIDFVKRKVTRAATEIMGKGIVEDVLILGVSQRQV